jgi:hypothetical protein
MNKKIGFVNALVGSIILNIFIVPLGAFGYTEHIWVLFTPLLIFFALGGDFKKIPSISLCFVVGILWFLIGRGIAVSLPLPMAAGMTIGLTIAIFGILFVHECLLKETILGTVPSVFLGFSLTSYSVNAVPEGVIHLTPIHLIVLFALGLLAIAVLMVTSFAVCSLIFGKEKTVNYFAKSEDLKKSEELVG